MEFNSRNLVGGGCILMSLLLVACGGGGSGGTVPTPGASTPGENQSPTITGTPSASVTQDIAYSFLPTAGDPDADNLTFTIVNLPSWANFNSTSGMLSGTPGVNDVGSYTGIGITVSDGSESATLLVFSIEVLGTTTGAATLSWTIPTVNADGTPLTDLAGFRIRYGMSAGNYPNTEVIANASISTFMVENLSSATWFFVVTAYDTSGNESVFSGVASKTI